MLLTMTSWLEFFVCPNTNILVPEETIKVPGNPLEPELEPIADMGLIELKTVDSDPEDSESSYTVRPDEMNIKLLET